jgi:hypothetical protein
MQPRLLAGQSCHHVASDFGDGLSELTRINVEAERSETGANDTYIIQRIDFDILKLVNVLVDTDVDIGHRTESAQPGISAAYGLQSLPIQIQVLRQIPD